ncbi:hypothetical protein [Inediibacterium massiliense]|uniref:hypothetical protein n=1 Tax=Inediibacterium massiliense TaxID=1658111 RepID=UPI0006B690F8|nr:hypothetical protein [Inediibacterium massiliense]
MGYRLTKFDFIPEENEQLEATLKLQKESRSVIHGVVKDECGKLVKDAVVKLFKVKKIHNLEKLIPITHTFTDEHGQFLFGPLCAHQKYLIKVWVNHVKIRELEICPEPIDPDCLGKDQQPCTPCNDNQCECSNLNGEE